MNEHTIHVTPSAAPNLEAVWESGFKWTASLDDLVRFVYGNQGTLFAEDAVPYRYGDAISVVRQADYARGFHRIFGTWEHSPLPRVDDEDAWVEQQMARGELASAPDFLPCYACGGYDGTGNGPERAVIALGGTVNPADPTQTYVLACGHVVM